MTVAASTEPGRRVKSRRGDPGFSMIELVVAMMILGIVLVLLAAVQISASITVAEARELQQATAFANEATEQMRAIPWNTLSKGMYSGFLAASGVDQPVSSGYLDVDGKHVQLVVATPANDQNLANPARPLFNEHGSNTQVRDDPSRVGVQFTIKAYVTYPTGGPGEASVGIAVVVEWPNRRGTISQTVVWSEAYRGSEGSCGNADTEPFLGACQSFFDASAGTGNVSAEVSASNVDPDPANIEAQPLTYPGLSSVYSLGMRSAGASASISSEQVNNADGVIQFGGNSTAGNDPATPADQRGFAVYTLRATDDVTNQSGWEPDPLDLPPTQGGPEDARSVFHSSSPVTLRARSDFARHGTAGAAMSGLCLAGIPAKQPCARSSLNNNGDGSGTFAGSGYLVMDLPEGTTFRLSRRLTEGLGSTQGNVESAWVARFSSAPGSAAVGCTTFTGAGCVSAGATRTMAPLSIGAVASGSLSWNGAANRGMAILEGDPSCPAGQNTYYTESVMVQRGAGVGQNTAAPTVSRCGLLEYWDGSSYTPVPIRNDALPTYNTAPVTWTSSDGVYQVVATTQIQILATYSNNPAPVDPHCQTAACTVSVSAGTITMVSTYDISWPGHEYILIAATTVTSPSAQATYKASPHVT